MRRPKKLRRFRYLSKSVSSKPSSVESPKPAHHPQNAEGPFYVANGECIACGAPEFEAGALMSHEDASGHCFFVRQPENPIETDSAIRAVWTSCCGAVRYGGKDESILIRLHQIELARSCDHYPAAPTEPELRVCGRFLYRVPEEALPLKSDPKRTAVEALARSLAGGLYGECSRFKYGRSNGSFLCKWGVPGPLNSIGIRIEQTIGQKWLLRFTDNDIAQLGFAISADKVLQRLPGVSEVEWFTEEQIRGGQTAGRPHPY